MVLVVTVFALVACVCGVWAALSGRVEPGNDALMLVASAIVGACGFAGVCYLMGW